MVAVPHIHTTKEKARAIYNRFGNPSSCDIEDVKRIANFSDDYYFKWNKVSLVNGEKGLGLGAAIALFEMITAWALIKLERSPATFANAFTTFSECLQVLISGYERTKINTIKIRNEKERHEAEVKLKKKENLRRVGIAGVIAGAGIGGVWKFIKEYFLKQDEHDIHELPIWQKVSLSVASLISSVGMGIGYGEKSLMATLAKRDNGGLKSEQMILNARSDGRCSMEWLAMTVFPWVSALKPARFLIDLAIPVSALHDGVSHLLEPLFEKDHKHFHNHHAEGSKHNQYKDEQHNSNWFKKVLKRIFAHDHLIKIPSFYFNSLFFGTRERGGIRSVLFKPLFKAFGCEPPDCYINRDKKLSVSVSGKFSDRDLVSDKGKYSARILTQAINSKEVNKGVVFAS